MRLASSIDQAPIPSDKDRAVFRGGLHKDYRSARLGALGAACAVNNLNRMRMELYRGIRSLPASFASSSQATPGNASFLSGSANTSPPSSSGVVESNFAPLCARLIPPAPAAPRSSAACSQRAAASGGSPPGSLQFFAFSGEMSEIPSRYRLRSRRLYFSTGDDGDISLEQYSSKTESPATRNLEKRN
jgi:hypothetical protein